MSTCQIFFNLAQTHTFFYKKKTESIRFKMFPLINIMMHAVNMQLHLIQYN